MLRYYLDKYDKDRTQLDVKVVTELMQESLKRQKLELEDETAHKIAVKFMVDLADFFYRNPDNYLSFGPFVIYRCAPNNKNLITIDSVKSNAKEIKDFYDNYGLEMNELKNLTEHFVEGLLEHSTDAEKKAADDIDKLKKATYQSGENTQKQKGEIHGS